MKTLPKVLACVDRSHFAETVADYAAWASRRLGAPLEFLHVMDRSALDPGPSDLSGAIGMDTQEHLLSALAESDAERSRALRESGRVFLNELRERAKALGVENPDTRQRHGALDETLAEQQEEVALFVFGRRGESAEATHRDLGRNVERMVRSLKRPILTVTEGFVEPSRVMIAFDGGPVIRRGVEMLAASPLLAGLPLLVLTVAKPGTDTQRGLDWALQKLTAAGYDARGKVTPGDAETVIARTTIDEGINLLVMGAFGHSPLRSLLGASKTSGILRSARIPTLLVR